MQFESDFSEANFTQLSPGQFFFHPLVDGEHSPAIKVRRADGVETAIDLNLELKDKSRLPTLVEPDGFKDLNVIFVEKAIIRPAEGVDNILNGASGAGSIPRGALVMAPGGQRLLRVKGPNLGTLYFDISSGSQLGTQDPDSAQCLWTTNWEVIVKAGDREKVLFERKA